MTQRARPLPVNNRSARRAAGWPIARLLPMLLAVLIGAAALAACGNEDDETTPTPAPATAPAATATAEDGAPGGTPAAASPVAGSPVAGVTVGALADRIAAAWASVTSYRAVTTSSAVAAATPAAATMDAVDEVIVPDRKRRLARSGGVVQYELIAVNGNVFARGPAIPGLMASPRDPDAWLAIDTAAIAADPLQAEAAELYEAFRAPSAAPYSALGREQRERDARLIGEVTIDGRACTAYQIADTSQIGERIEIVLSLDAADLPCAIETRLPGAVTITIFTFDVALTIEAPADATPFARR